MSRVIVWIERDGLFDYFFGQIGGHEVRLGGFGSSEEVGADHKVSLGLDLGAISKSEFGEEFLSDAVHIEEHGFECET